MPLFEIRDVVVEGELPDQEFAHWRSEIWVYTPVQKYENRCLAAFVKTSQQDCHGKCALEPAFYDDLAKYWTAEVLRQWSSFITGSTSAASRIVC